MIEATMLGTGCPLPAPDRAGAATLVESGGRRVLVDCGRGVLMRLSAAGVGPMQLEDVLITHLHSDHVQDLSDVITMHWTYSFEPRTLRVTGPPGLADFVRRLLAAMEDDIGFRMAHHHDLTWRPMVEVTEVSSGTALRYDDLHVTTELVDHGPVRPALGFRFDANGSSVCVSGDTVPCAGLDTLCAGADVLVQAVVRSAVIERLPSVRIQDVLDYHTSTFDAGRTAARGGVGRLVLTHLVPSPVPGTEAEWVEEAASTFDGEVSLASDLDAVRA